MMDWTDQHYRASHRLMRRRTLYAEMVASAARVELNRSDLCDEPHRTIAPYTMSWICSR